MVFVKTSLGTQTCHKCRFLNYNLQGMLAWVGLWRQLLSATSSWIYKMLVACASDNKGRSLFSTTNIMLFIVTSNALDRWYKRTSSHSMNLYHRCSLKNTLKYHCFSQTWSVLWKTRTKSALFLLLLLLVI